MANLGTVWAELSLRMDRFNAALQSAEAKVVRASKAMEERVNHANARLTRSYEAALGPSQALAATIAGLGAVLGAGAIAAIRSAASWEQAQVAFRNLLGSAEEADKFLRDLTRFASETPFELPGLTSAAQKLMAFGFEAKQVIPLMTAVGDAVSGVGGNAQTIDRVVIALGQMRAKSKVTSEEMMQLAESNTFSWEALAKSLGVSVPEAMKMAEKGTISAGQGIMAFWQNANTRFKGMMEEQSKTIFGRWSTLRDNLNQISIQIGDRLAKALGVTDRLAAFNQQLEEILNTIREKGLRTALASLFTPELQHTIAGVAGAIAGMLVPALIALGKAIWKLVGPLRLWALLGAAVAEVALFIYQHWNQLKTLLGGVIRSISLGFQQLALSVAEAWNAIKRAVYSRIADVLAALQPLARLLPASWEQAFSRIQAVVASKAADTENNLTRLGLKSIALADQMEAATSAAGSAWSSMWEKTARAADGVGKAAEDAEKRTRPALEGIETKAKQTSEETQKAADKMRQVLIQSADRLYDAVLGALRKQKEEALRIERDRVDGVIRELDREYRERLKLIDDQTARAIADLEDQIEAIDDQTDAEERALKDQEELTKIAELEKALAAADSAEERERIQKQLSEAVQDRERRLLLQSRQDQKEALRQQIEDIRNQAAEKRRLLEEELEERKRHEQALLAAFKDRIQKELEDRRLAAEAEKLLLSKNQEELIALLQQYGEGWKDLGKSYGERLLEGFRPYLEELRRMIADVTGYIPDSSGEVNASEGLTPAPPHVVAALRPSVDAGHISREDANKTLIENGYLPAFERGGILNSPTLAWLAETPRARPEVVSPLSDLLGIVRQAVRREVGGAASGEIRVIIQLDGRTIAEKLLPQMHRTMILRGVPTG